MMLNKSAMIAITTSSSMSVNASLERAMLRLRACFTMGKFSLSALGGLARRRRSASSMRLYVFLLIKASTKSRTDCIPVAETAELPRRRRPGKK
jgi:hypothetical protein